jgi:hypothetical protein
MFHDPNLGFTIISLPLESLYLMAGAANSRAATVIKLVPTVIPNFALNMSAAAC